MAVYVYEDVMISSPGPISSIRSIDSNHAVALFWHTAMSDSQNLAICLSNSLVRGPVVIHPDNRAALTSCASCSVISGGENGIFIIYLLLDT